MHCNSSECTLGMQMTETNKKGKNIYLFIFSFFVNLLKMQFFISAFVQVYGNVPGVTFVEVLAGCSTNKRVTYYLTVCVYEVSSN